MILSAVLYSAVAGLFFTNSAIERSENRRLGEMKAGDLARITAASLLWPAACAVVAYTVFHESSRGLHGPAAQPDETFA